MSKRQNNQLPNNLPQLQNLIKRDPESYKEEFLQQLRHFSSTLQVFELSPTEFNENLDELIMFLAQVAKCYPDNLSEYPQTLIDLLRKVRNPSNVQRNGKLHNSNVGVGASQISI